jgi:F-box-like
MPSLSADYVDQDAAILAGQIDILRRRESELRALLDAVTHEKHAIETQRNQLEKDRIPFHWLPPELLIHIFVLATVDSLCPIQLPLDIIPLYISHVCQRWRNVALSTPEIWRRVVLTPSDLSFRSFLSPATQTFFDRSKGVPLEVICASLPKRTNIKASSFTPRSIPALRVRECHRPGESYILHAFPTLRSLCIHGNPDIIVDALAYLHNHPPGFTSLESLELALETTTPGELYDRLRLGNPERAHCNPWRTYRFPTLQALTLRNIPLAGIALGQLPMLRDLTLTIDSPLSGRLEFLRLLYFARLLACAPRVERLAFLRAGPVFSFPLDTSPQALRCWEDDAAWRADSSRPLPPVLLEHLRELEWTDVHPETLHLLIMQFPTPRLEVLDIAFASPSKCKKLAAWLHPTFVLEWDSAAVQPALELSNLKVLRADCPSGDVLRSPFFRLYFPALETLSLSNRNRSRRCSGPRCLANDDLDQLPQLPRLESIFRDPRLPHLTHLLLSGFAISPEHAILTLGYMPCLQRLDCNFILSVASLLDALAAVATTSRSGSESVGVRVCPQLRNIQLWYCDGVESTTLTRLIKLRNGFESEDEIAASRDVPGGRPIKPLPKGAHPTAGPMLWQSMGTNNERLLEKIEQVSVECCHPITGAEARALRQWGAEVQWVARLAPPGLAASGSQ